MADQQQQKAVADGPAVYIDEDTGKDSSDSGSESSPYKSLQFAYIATEGNASAYQTRKSQTGDVAEGADESSRLEWRPATKSALKKAATMLKNHKQKQGKEQELALREKKDDDARQAAMEEAKKIVVKDPGTPSYKIKLDATTYAGEDGKQVPVVLKSGTGAGTGTRVRVLGRAQQIRKQKANMFVELRDGYGKMQVVFTGDLAKTYDAITLTRESSMEIYGEMWEVPAGAKAPMDRELHADYFVVKAGWKAAGGDDAITSRIAPDAEHSLLLDLRHLTLRGDKASSIMLVRDAVEGAFHHVFREMRMRKVSPPALVQTQVEGGATLFKFDYYGEEAFLTQSSQLYLETCLASLGNVYCIEKSFRAEKSLTRRHLSEYTHVEGELDFITFEDLLVHLEEVMCRVLETVFEDPAIASALKELNPSFAMPSRPFLRMRYSDAITWLNEHEIPNEEGQPHIFGDDIAEAAERRMTDIINKPIFLTHFPVEIKAFYMQKDPEDPRVTESVDCLMPGVGEIIGGSMRMDDYQELEAAYKREGIPHEPYYWYTDQRKYGSSPHGGYGLGLERFLAWLCGLHTVRDACLYPRFMGRCKP